MLEYRRSSGARSSVGATGPSNEELPLTGFALTPIAAALAAELRCSADMGMVNMLIRCAVAGVLGVGMLRSASEGSASEPEWRKYSVDDGRFTFEHPANWRVEQEGNHLHVAPAAGGVHLFVNAFQKADESLARFAALRFAVQSDSFKAVEHPIAVEGTTWKGLMEEAEDVRSERTEDTTRVLMCAQRNDLFVTLALYLDPVEWKSRRAYYDRLFKSLRFAK